MSTGWVFGVLAFVVVLIILMGALIPISNVMNSDTKAINLPPQPSGELSLPVKNLTTKWPNSPEWHIVSDNLGDRFMKVVNGDTLMATYPKGSYIPSSPSQGGFQFYAQPNMFPATHIAFSYQVMFPRNFNWVKGGKLPGIWIGNMGANGGNHLNNGASFRVMWRANGVAEAYLYIPTQTTKELYNQPGYVYNDQHGDSLWRGQFKFQTSTWNMVTLTAKINTIGSADGTLGLTINNDARTLSSIIWANTATHQYINGLMMHSFFGGNDTTWASPIEQNIYFKDFKISNIA